MENQHPLIKGCRSWVSMGATDLQTDEISLMNEIKTQGKQLGDLVATLKQMPALDQRWVAIGATDLQTGLMALTRAVAQPTFF